MQLLAPEVKGPISVCNTKVRIRGHIAGATVKVLVNDVETASKMSNWPDDVFDVGKTLNAGDKITAVQEFGGTTSPQTPLPVIVQSPPSSLINHLTIRTNLHQCGTAVFAEGAVPGAEVEARINNNPVGSSSSIDGAARIQYSPGLNIGQSLSLHHTTCNNLSKVTVSPIADPLPNPLPVPKIGKPLIECMTAIKISNVIDGATITIYRDGIEEGSVVFDLPAITWVGLEPLEEGELIEIEQSFTCIPETGAEPTKIVSGKASDKVQSALNLKKPVVLGPVCPDAIFITVTNLLPGTRVILYQDGNEIGMTDTPDSTYSFNAPPLKPNGKITARMELCGVKGPMSDPVDVKGDQQLGYIMEAQFYECASYISFANPGLRFGKIVYVKNGQGDVISAYHQVYRAWVLIPVSPALVATDKVVIVVIGCNNLEETFGPYEVESLKEHLPPPTIVEPVTEGSNGINLRTQITGALVKVYVDNVFKGSVISRGMLGYAGYQETPIVLPEPLKLGQVVHAIQSLCGLVSEHSNPATVVIPPPQVPLLIQPAMNASGRPAKPVTFKWEDPGANTTAAATGFQLDIFKSNTLVHSASGSTTQTTANLEYSSSYSWRVTSKNSTGKTTSQTFAFTTESKPEPPKEALLSFGSQLYASYDGITLVWPVPADTAFYLCIIVGNYGNAPSDPFKIIFSWQGENHTGSSTIDAPSFPQNHSELAYRTFPNGLPEGQYFFEVSLVVNNSVIDYTSWSAWIGF